MAKRAIAVLVLDHKSVVSKIQNAVNCFQPFSFIRLGDGEGRVMAFPEHVSILDLCEIWTTWFGHSFVSDIQVRFLQEELRISCNTADIIGIPVVEEDLDDDFGRVTAIANRYGYFPPGILHCSSGIHLELEHYDLYKEFLFGLPQVVVIGCRDVRSVLMQRFSINKVTWIQTPPEMAFSNLSAEEKMQQMFLNPHFIKVFRKIYSDQIPTTLRQSPGTVVLIGAGVLGKIYASRVKSFGGIAIDIGSVMDLWSGLRTRFIGYFDGMQEVSG